MIVTADHGYSFQVGVRSRRLLSERNVEEIAPVPFFVKAPGPDGGTRGREPRPQHRRGCDDRGPARQLGLLQAGRALGVLGRHAGAKGSSGSARATSPRRCASAPPRCSAAARSGGSAGRACSAPGIESGVLYGDPWAMAYRIGPHPELLGRRVSSLAGRSEEDVSARDRKRLARRARGRRATRCSPTRVTGPLRGVPFGEHRDLAVAVNGRIEAVGAASTSGSRDASSSRCWSRSDRCAAGATDRACSRCCRTAAAAASRRLAGGFGISARVPDRPSAGTRGRR